MRRFLYINLMLLGGALLALMGGRLLVATPAPAAVGATVAATLHAPDDAIGSIHGVVYVRLAASDGRIVPVQLPGFTVRLETDASPRVSTTVTDEYGRFVFTSLNAGAYRLLWNQDDNPAWHAGQYSTTITMSTTPSELSKTIHLPPVVVMPIHPDDLVWGRARFADGASPWYRDPLFALTETVAITLLNYFSQPVASGLTTNGWGEFIIPNAPVSATQMAAQLVVWSPNPTQTAVSQAVMAQAVTLQLLPARPLTAPVAVTFRAQPLKINKLTARYEGDGSEQPRPADHRPRPSPSRWI